MATPHETLLASIRNRQEKRTEWNRGVLTADRYVKTLQECVGSDLCYRYAAKGTVSFQDILKKSASVLTYNNEDMVLKDVYTEAKSFVDVGGESIELPKNTLMVFRHVLTSSRKDRDGDILRTGGAKIDPKMLLLWQHVHTLPIGKYLGTTEHTSKRLEVVSAIVDLNELAHDSAVMVANKMGRFSHGFKAIDYAAMKGKGEEGHTTSPGGFDVKIYEVMEESLVSVPSNVDAETEEVILDLLGKKELTSRFMKSYGQTLRNKLPTSVNVPVNLDLNIRINGKTLNEDIEDLKRTKVPAEKCGCGGTCETCAPGKTDDDSDSAKGSKDEKMTCPECGGKMVDGVCEKCGYEAEPEDTKAKAKADVCPECEGKMVDGVCEKCGYEAGSDDDEDDDKKSKAGKLDICPKCEGKMADGVCEKCGYKAEPEEEKSLSDRKSGRVLSSKNMESIKYVRENLQDMPNHELVMTRGGRAILKDCVATLDGVIKSATVEEPEPERNTEIDITKAMAVFVSQATAKDRSRMREVLDVLDRAEQKRTTPSALVSILKKL